MILSDRYLRLRRNVVVARENHRHAFSQQCFAVCGEALEPFQLVFEFRAWLRIAVRQVDAAYDYPFDRGLNVAALVVARIARQDFASQDRIAIPTKDRHSIPGFLTIPDRAVSSIVQCIRRKALIRCFQFLQA